MMSETSSENGWTRVDRTAFEVLSIDENELSDELVRTAYEDRLREATTEEERRRLFEAFRTIETEPCRTGYRLALTQFETRERENSDASAGESPPALVHAAPTKGIAGILCAPDAPYARLLQAALQVKGNFELELPQIIVCGAESQGKSSTLERIAMRDIFPRDRRFCTRMPVRLMLRTSRHQNQVTIRVKDLDNGEIRRETDPQICVTGDQTDEPFSAEVAELIRDFIREEHPEDTGRSVVTDREVQIEIRAPSVPTIDLVDLPGIVSAPENARLATTSITQRMLAQEHVLVLAVVSARSEALNNNIIWPLMRAANKPSIVVLTRVDEPGGEEDLRARLERDPAVMPDDVPIRIVVPVANRDTRRHIDRDSLRNSYTREETALREACAKEEIEYDTTKHGMPGVLHALNELIRTYMRDQWVTAELQRCRNVLMVRFRNLWGLGMTPQAISQNSMVSEIQRGLNALKDMPTPEVLQEVESRDCFAFIREFPGNAPLLRRAQLLDDCKEKLMGNTKKLISDNWESFKELAMRKILDESELPLKIGRFSFIREHIRVTLEDSFDKAKMGITEKAFSCAFDQLEEALMNRSDEIETDQIRESVCDAVNLRIIASIASKTLVEHLYTDCHFELEEEPGVAGKREAIEDQIDAVYRTVNVLQELQDLEGIPEDFGKARLLIDAGVTEELKASIKDKTFPTDFLSGTFGAWNYRSLLKEISNE
ncbi:Interferon-induced GTP-binding protein Mx1 [Hondaea fermentalgiana]|uniref:Interferon-induced GTP-binding protein Mx1 n=1 Tax=Hondaea fermentalgiana TaxID=2315210 RepID=A0A2R5GC87_9STRA|nr:Interferon-induced GTP-binding protein Mx1 [Hondaea fermentalgiana]|eukprot:GBG28587.1 Interferon-induced GTP-binding protein Mx1 [Hondaea fermentalgiana]